MKKASILIIIVSILSKLLGFIRETVLAATYGASYVSDAFIFAYGLPATLFSVVAAAFVTGFIPMYSRVEANDGDKEANRFLNNVLHVMIIFCIVIAAFFLLVPEVILGFLLPNASAELLSLVIPFTQITVFSVFMTCIIQLMTGFLQLKNSFVFPMMMGFPMNIVVITTIVLSRSIGSWILPYGILISYCLQAALIVAYAFKKGYRYKFVLDLKDKQLRTMLALAIPLIIGSSSTTIGDLINKAILSGFEGGVSYLNYSTRLGGILQSVFGAAITNVAYPSLSRSIARNETLETHRSFGDALISITLFIAPASLGLIVLAQPIVQLVYMRGEFTAEDLAITVPVFVGYSIGLLAISLRDLFTRMFYSYQDMKTPMWNSILMAAIQAALAIVLFNVIGIAGVTLSMAISNIVGLGFIALQLRKYLKGFPFRHYLGQAARVLVSSFAMAGVAYFLYQLVFGQLESNLIAVAVAIMAGVIVYVVMVFVFRVEAVMELVSSFKRRLKR